MINMHLFQYPWLLFPIFFIYSPIILSLKKYYLFSYLWLILSYYFIPATILSYLFPRKTIYPSLTMSFHLNLNQYWLNPITISLILINKEISVYLWLISTYSYNPNLYWYILLPMTNINIFPFHHHCHLSLSRA